MNRKSRQMRMRNNRQIRRRSRDRSIKLAILVTLVALVLWPLMAMTASAQTGTANKSVYAEPLTAVIVPGEIALAAVGFKGDYDEGFGAYRLKVDTFQTTPGIEILGWSQLSGQERIVIRFLTDSRLQAGLAVVVFHIYDEAETDFPMQISFTVAKPLPNEFFTAARKVAVGSVPLYNALQGDGRVQALSNFQTKRSFKRVAEVYAGILEAHDWTIVQSDISDFGGVMEAEKGDADVFINMYTDPLHGDRWVTVGVTQ